MSSSSSGTTSGTSTATTTANASSTTPAANVVVPDTTATTLTTDVYGLFIGAFFIVLTLIVLFSTGSILSVLVLWTLVALILVVLIYYGFVSIDQLLGTSDKKAKEKPVEKPMSRPSGGPLLGSEVFHVADQQFTYDEAPAVCAAYGADLATLEQIMDAFANGAEWCGYGWSSGGMALYPTQLETWKRLQGEVDNGKRTRCGRPGVNGGYFNPSLKFGVNCFGFKPEGAFKPPAPVPGIDGVRFNAMVNRFRELLKSFTLNPYSRQEWSEFDDKKERFVGDNGLFKAFKQDFFTPFGVREHLEGGSADYVEPISETGLGQAASSLRGPYGLKGDIGDKGPAGPKGDQGVPGPQGVIGPGGPQGNPGVRGADGLKGDRGDKGDQGERGPVGSGSAGGIGPKGDAGPKGSKGDIGPGGPQGGVGPAGAVGPQGIQGVPGASGLPVRILTAQYGAPGGSFIDVRSNVANRLRDSGTFRVDNTYGDPARDRAKTLSVVYSLGGETKTKSIPENSNLDAGSLIMS